MDVEYRHIKPGELNDLLELYKQLIVNDEPLPETTKLQQIWQEILTDKKIHLLVAAGGDRILGSCILTIIPNLTHGGKPYSLIENVITHAGYRKNGIGAGLMKYAQQVSWDNGCYKVMLMTGRQTAEIYRFYEKAGFRRGVKTGFIIRAGDVK